MARELGVPLHVFDFKGGRASRQLRAIVATVRLLRVARPSVVFASNPSVVLTFLLLACRPFFGYRFATDAHYGGVIAVTGSRFFQKVLDFVNRHADFVIVTNSVHAARIRSIGGTPFVCPDPLPQLPALAPRPAGMNGTQKSVLFICSYDLDEPYPAVFTAASRLADSGFKLFVSGPYARAGLTQSAVPNAVLLGYVDRPTYDAYLKNVDVVLDLTTWQDCLVCGAYEAMAAGKPAVLSRTTAMTELFTHGTVFSSHDPDDIARAVFSAYEQRKELASQIGDWTVRHQQAIRNRVAELSDAVGLQQATT
jgi:glycosyltransferase involved in cell wall biosynthesis